MLAAIRNIYQSTKKNNDINWFTEFLCRPPAAVVVVLVKNTRISPNQITFLSFLVCAIAAVILAFLPSYFWLVMFAIIFELSFILDCADGQLARARGKGSPIGHHLDFLMDEIKAMMLMVAVSIRVAFEAADDRYLLVGLFGLLALSAGMALTSFTRRPEYTGPKAETPPSPNKRGPIQLIVWLLNWIGRIFVHYPQYIWIAALLNRMDWFLWAFASIHALYFLRTYAIVFFKLGRFESKM